MWTSFRLKPLTIQNDMLSVFVHFENALLGLSLFRNLPFDIVCWVSVGLKLSIIQIVCCVIHFSCFGNMFWQECFDPIVAISGRDLIPVMVYG